MIARAWRVAATLSSPVEVLVCLRAGEAVEFNHQHDDVGDIRERRAFPRFRFG